MGSEPILNVEQSNDVSVVLFFSCSGWSENRRLLVDWIESSIGAIQRTTIETTFSSFPGQKEPCKLALNHMLELKIPMFIVWSTDSHSHKKA